jgi:hypothetical protein
MLVVAGVIEGFFSPSHAPVAAKFALATVLFAALFTYLFLSQRRIDDPATADSVP